MDPRYYHEKFDQIILDSFEDVIKEFEFNVKTNPNWSQVELWNAKCIIRFIYDSGSVSISFVNPVEKAGKEKIVRKDGFPAGYPNYPVFSVWNFLYPNDQADFNSTHNDIAGQALSYKRIILKKLENVLSGDFSWSSAYKVREAGISAKIEYMTKHWASDNPVILQFKEGNPEWEKAFDEYKSYLDNLQQDN